MSKTCPFRVEIIKEQYPSPSGNGGFVESSRQQFCQCYEEDCPYYDEDFDKWVCKPRKPDTYCKRLQNPKL